MRLINPATYLSVSQFKAQPNDYNLSSYTDSQLQDLLVRASGKADSIMCTSYIPEEVTEQFEGEGTNLLILARKPLIYVKAAQLVMPGFSPFQLPLGQLMVDYERGSIRSWSPMIFQSLGVANVFPRNGLPIVLQYAYGYGYPIPPPAFSIATGANGSLTPGQPINFAVSTRTQPGESLPSLPQTVTPTSGAVTVNISITPGAYVYRIYASQGTNTTLSVASSIGDSSFTVTDGSQISPGDKLVFGFGSADVETLTIATVVGNGVTTTSSAVNAHGVGEAICAPMTLVAESPATNYGQAVMPITVVSLAPPPIGAMVPQTVDSTAWPIPNAIIEATRVLALAILYEQNNPANRGAYQQRSGDRAVSWRSTAGQGGEGHPVMVTEAQEMLAPFAYQGIF